MSAWQLSLRGPVFLWAQARHTDNCEGNNQGHFKFRTPVAVHAAGYPYSATQQDVIFVNGGLQPIIRMAPGEPQLWRIVNAAWKVQGLTFPHCINSKAEIQDEHYNIQNAGGLALDGKYHPCIASRQTWVEDQIQGCRAPSIATEAEHAAVIMQSRSPSRAT